MQTRTLTGTEALAESLFRCGVSVVAGYPGSPATGVMDAFRALAASDPGRQARWMINEKVATEYCLGSSAAGCRSAVVLKNVGFNLILDSLVISGLTGVNGGCLIILGDDPGSMHSSHEEDARLLAAAAEIPLLEPGGPERAPDCVQRGIEISEQHRIPVVLRFTPTFGRSWGEVHLPEAAAPPPPAFQASSQITGSACMPDFAVDLHRRVHAVLRELAAKSRLSSISGSGKFGIAAVGDSWLKVRRVLAEAGLEGAKVLRLEETNPLPEDVLQDFFRGLDRVLVVEEVLPLAEEKMRAYCQRRGLDVRILGKQSGDLPAEDMLFAADIYRAIAEAQRIQPDEAVLSVLAETKGVWGGGSPLCPGCPYGRVLDALDAHWSNTGCVEPALAVEPGCGVRLNYSPYQRVTVKLCMGSAIPAAAAMSSLYPGERPVAVVGESAFCNSGIPALIQACRTSARILVVVVNNYSAALTGFQPTLDLEPDRLAATLARIVEAAAPAFFERVEENEMHRLGATLTAAHAADGPAVLLVNAACTGRE
jgi:indolepyruvate ferredoxin oxidoreductase alpha subunit